MDRLPESLPPPVSLRRLFPAASFLGGIDIVASDAVEHSQACHPDALFAVIRGTRVNAAAFVNEALSRGVAGMLVDRPLPDVPVTQCVVPDVRRAFSQVCAQLAGSPSTKIDIAGVTGTNGKTTVTWMIRAILHRAGRTTGVLGTVEFADGVQSEAATMTTPDSRTLHGWLSRMAQRGTTAAAIELSSHALHQGRAEGTQLRSALVTNITQDHFDYHQTFDAYRDSKAQIVEMIAPGGILGLNCDDPGSWSLQNRCASVVSFGMTPAADVFAQILEESRRGTRFRLHLHGQSAECFTTLIGRHNVSNCLAAAVATAHQGVALEDIVAGVEHFRGVPGRMERIDCGQPFDVFVDYAHTDDALQRCLASVRSLTAGRVLCVFGAGGDRDRSKRPLLGRAAALADVAIVTSDNPRREDPLAIISDILNGMPVHRDQSCIEPDREQAIRRACSLAQPGDCVIIAGKGHEREQIIGRERLPFDDRTVARSALRDLHLTGASLAPSGDHRRIA